MWPKPQEQGILQAGVVLPPEQGAVDLPGVVQLSQGSARPAVGEEGAQEGINSKGSITNI